VGKAHFFIRPFPHRGQQVISRPVTRSMVSAAVSLFFSGGGACAPIIPRISGMHRFIHSTPFDLSIQKIRNEFNSMADPLNSLNIG